MDRQNTKKVTSHPCHWNWGEYDTQWRWPLEVTSIITLFILSSLLSYLPSISPTTFTHAWKSPLFHSLRWERICWYRFNANHMEFCSTKLNSPTESAVRTVLSGRIPRSEENQAKASFLSSKYLAIRLHLILIFRLVSYTRVFTLL